MRNLKANKMDIQISDSTFCQLSIFFLNIPFASFVVKKALSIFINFI
jgi:hypothetical protein